MAESKSKSSLMKKYVSILQTDSKPGTAKPFYSATSSLNRTSSEVLEKVILSRKLNINQSLSSFQDPNITKQPSSTKAKHSGFDFIPTPNYRTPRPSITATLPFQGYGGRSSSQEDLPPGTLNLFKHDMQHSTAILSPKDSVVEVPTYFKIKSIKNISKTFDKETTLHTVYEGARDVSAELESIVSQKYQKKLGESMAKYQTKDFINIQSLRVANVLKVIERNFVDGQIREPQFIQEVWKMVSIEINKIKAVYDEFLESYTKLTGKLKEAKQKTQDSQDFLDGLKNLILYSECYRNVGSTWDQSHREENLDDLKKAMHIFKLDLKFRSKANRRTFEVYEHAEGHIKGLNQLLDAETEKVQSLIQENMRLVNQQEELVSRQTALKNELISIMDKKEADLRNKSKEGLPEFQRRLYQDQITDQDKQVKKLTAENESLKTSVRTMKEELKKFYPKGGAGKGQHDKGTMVNFYSDAPQKAKSVFKFCTSFNQSPVSMVSGTKLPDVLGLSIISLVYSDKLMTDMVDDFEKRPRKALAPYLFEWLLKRIGLFSVSEGVLKDFLFTIKHSKIQYERYKTFLSMIGLQESFTVPKKSKHDPESSIDIKELKKKAYVTAECTRNFFKLVEQVNTLNASTESPTLKSLMNDFGPFLPREDSTKAVINTQIARDVMNLLFKEYGFTVSESEDALDEFHIVQQQSFFQKLGTKATIDEVAKDDDTIKFDALIDFLLDLCAGRQVKVIEQVYTTLRATTTSSSEDNISYEEFSSAVGKIFPKKSQVWRDHIFAKLMDQPTASQVSLQKLIPNTIGVFYQEDQARDFQAPKAKGAANSGSNTPKSPKKSTGSNTPNSRKASKRFEEIHSDQLLLPDTIDEGKAAFQYGSKALNEMAYHHYDAVSSLIVLQEIFYLMEASIKQEQENNEVLNFTYKTFVEEMKAFPKHFGYIANYKDIRIMKKRELVNVLEYLWGLLRTMLVQTFRDTIKSP